MSDDKVDLTPFESYTQNRLDNMWDKISELEANRKISGEERLDNYELIGSLTKEIAELSDRVDNKTDINFVGGLLKLRDDEIAELRECLEIAAQREKFLGDNDGLIIQELNELKERFGSLEHKIGDFTDIDYIRIKEVLRELMILLDREFNFEDIDMPIEMNKLLAKLEVRSAAHTVKAIFPNFDKKVKINPISFAQDDSKPPEPKHDYCPQYEGDFDKEDRLPGGTGTEPREDEPKIMFKKHTWIEEGGDDVVIKWFDGKDYDLVKREDLQEIKQLLADMYHGLTTDKEYIYKVWAKLKGILEERLSDATDGGVRD